MICSCFCRRKFGASLLDNLVAPFVSGVYAGDPEQLSLRAAFPQVHEWEKTHGSVLRGAIKQMRQKPKDGGERSGLVSFPRGVGSFLDALRARLGTSVHSGVSVNSVTLGDEGSGARFTLEIETGERRETIAASAVVIATEPHAAANLLRPISLQLKIARADCDGSGRDGRGGLTAARRRITCSTALDSSCPVRKACGRLAPYGILHFFPGRAPQGHVAMTSFVGGATDPEITTRPEEANRRHRSRRTPLGCCKIREQPVVQRVHRYERAAAAIQHRPHSAIEQLSSSAARIREFTWRANYLGGPSFGACVERASK